MRIRRFPGGITLLDDTYNANPASAAAAVETLVDLSGGSTSVAVVGDMLELGQSEEEGHVRVGEAAAAAGVGRLLTFGPRSEATARAALAAGMSRERVFHSTEVDRLMAVLAEATEEGAWVLLKGSRGTAMERFIPALGQELSEEEP